MSGPTVGATWVDRGTTAASKAARAMWMDVHHGELARCVEAALAAVAPLIAAQERERCAKAAEREAALWMEKARESALVPIEETFKRYATSANQIAAAIRALGDAT